MDPIPNDRARDLLERYRGMVITLCRPYYAHLVSMGLDEDDLHAEAHIAMLRAVRTYNGHGAEGGWVATVIRNHLADLARKHSPHSRGELDRIRAGDEDTLRATAGRQRRYMAEVDDNTPGRGDVDFDRIHTRQFLERAMECLTPRQRAVIDAYLDGLTGEAVARVAGGNGNTASSQRAHAIHKMRRAMRDEIELIRGGATRR